MSSPQNIPCLNPTKCKVQSHKPGTVAPCMNTQPQKPGAQNLRLSSAAVDPYLPEGPEKSRKMELRSRSRDLSQVESMQIAKWACSRSDESLGVSTHKIASINNLADNIHVHGSALHYIATGDAPIGEQKGELRPGNDGVILRAIVKNPNVEDRTLAVIARKSSDPYIAGMAKERIDARTGFFRRMIRRVTNP